MRRSREPTVAGGRCERPSSNGALVALKSVAGFAAVGGAWYAPSGAPDVPTERLTHSPFLDDTLCSGLIDLRLARRRRGGRR